MYNRPIVSRSQPEVCGPWTEFVSVICRLCCPDAQEAFQSSQAKTKAGHPVWWSGSGCCGHPEDYSRPQPADCDTWLESFRRPTRASSSSRLIPTCLPPCSQVLHDPTRGSHRPCQPPGTRVAEVLDLVAQCGVLLFKLEKVP